MGHHGRLAHLGGLAALLVASGPAFPAATSTARECLRQAAVAASGTELPGDQSAARREIVVVLSRLDPNAALEMSGGIRRPSDAARALGAVARALGDTQPERAQGAAATASRLLLRIVEPERREQELRLLLSEIAVLGEKALPAAAELPAGEARAAIVLGAAAADPELALNLLDKWKLTGGRADVARLGIASGLVGADPDRALTVTADITSDGLRRQALWLIAERVPPAEAYGIAQRVDDPVVHAAVLASAAARGASEDVDVALSVVDEIQIARGSALAEVAVALVQSDRERALGLARGLPDRPRSWALTRMAAALAGSEPDAAEGLLDEAGAGPEGARLVAVGMAAVDPSRALRSALSRPEGASRDAALAAVVPAIARSDLARARELLWEIGDADARARAAGPVILGFARTDVDAATSLIGLISGTARALQVRGQVAVIAAPRDADLACRLLETLPPSSYRREAAAAAAMAVLSAGGSREDALRLAAIGTERDLALRWILPALAAEQMASPVSLAESIGDRYLRALGLVDVARQLEGGRARARPTPERAHLVRLVAEWEGV